jgi:hypothetical protein
MNVQPSQPNPSVTNDSTTENVIGKMQSEGEQEVDKETATKYTWQTIKKKKGRETAQIRKAEPNTSNSTAITGMSNSHIYRVMIMMMITTIPYSLAGQIIPKHMGKLVNYGILSLHQYLFTG